ncbi:MAG: helix-hairpin-helix domain-containing protein [Saprospiraceae bacterium]|nr:helix-hairpin-helix domain-containing protein [Saprospiraceae bacterium]
MATLILQIESFGLERWWWLLLAMLFPLLLGILLGYWLWYRYRREADILAAENAGLKDKLSALESDLASLKYQFDELQKDNTALKASLNSVEADKSILQFKLEQLTGEKESGEQKLPESRSAGSYFGSMPLEEMIPADNLQIVEGIGPKLESVLKKAGIANWSDLAASNTGKLKEILTNSNPNYRIHDPSHWPQQARLADRGSWEELIRLQREISDPKGSKGEQVIPSKVEKLGLKILGFSGDPEDLTIIEGIGPKIEKLLKEAGVQNWKSLADASEEKLRSVLEQAGSRYKSVNPATWPPQATLAVEGKWKELKDYQDKLKEG